MKVILKIFIVTFSFMFLFFYGCGNRSELQGGKPMLKPIECKTNHLINPQAIDTIPIFQWIDQSTMDNEIQTAYQILVSDNEDQLRYGNGNYWNSGKINSDKNFGIVYQGKELKNATRYFWTVRTWNNSGLAGEFSDVACFDTGYNSLNAWKGVFFEGDIPRYRKKFIINKNKEIVLAKVYIGGIGAWEVSLNGKKCSDNILDSYQTVIRERVFYQGYELKNLRVGENVLAIELGNGTAGSIYVSPEQKRIIVQAEILYSDGTRQMIKSDKSWKATMITPIIKSEKNGLYNGEKYDARKEQKNWKGIKFSEEGWKQVEELAILKAPADYKSVHPETGKVSICQLTALRCEPMRELRKLEPVEIKEVYDNIYVVDFGENISGYTQIIVNGREGDKIELTHAESITNEWNDYSLEVNGRIVKDNAGLAFRVVDRKNYYYWRLDITGKLIEGKVVGGEYIHIKDIDFDFKEGELFKIKIDAAGQTINTYLNNELVDTLTDDSFKSGTIGMCQPNDSKSKFLSFNVTTKSNRCLMAQNACTALWEGEKPIFKEHNALIVENDPLVLCKCGNVDGGIERRTLTTAMLFPNGDGGFSDQYDYYICDGDGQATWQPKYTLHGFRYVRIDGYPGKLTKDKICAKMVAHDLYKTTSTAIKRNDFVSSDKMLNKILYAAMLGEADNMVHGSPMSCQNRNERIGWTGDAETYSQAVYYFSEAYPIYLNWFISMRDTQHPDGYIDNIAPRQGERASSIEEDIPWSSASVNVTFDSYFATGDLTILTEQWESLKAFLKWCENTDNRENVFRGKPDYTTDKDCWGDYGCTDGDQIDKPLLATAFYYQMTQKMVYFANLLGKSADVEYYMDLSKKIFDSFNLKFFSKDKGPIHYGRHYRNTQTTNAVALYCGLVPDEYRKAVTDNLVMLLEDNSYTPTTGVIGTYCLFDALAENGREDVAFKVVSKTDKPSWADWILNGETTMPEFWFDGYGYYGSRNHPFTGGRVAGYIFRYLCGIKPIEAGYRRFALRMPILDGLDWFESKSTCVNGNIVFNWKKINNGCKLECIVPVNTKAIIYVPLFKSSQKTTVIHNGKVIYKKGRPQKHSSVKYLCKENNYLLFEIGSGSSTLNSL